MIERRHRIERVRERTETQTDRENALAIVRRRMAGRTHDALIEEEARQFVDAVHLGRHRDHHERAATGFDHFVRRRNDPVGAVDAAKFRIDERAFEVHAEAARAGVMAGFFELVRGFRDFIARVHHRFPRRGHHPGNVAGRAHAGVGARRDVDRVALIAVEQHVVGAVGVNVDQTGSDDRSGRRHEVARAVFGVDFGDAAVLDDDPSIDGRAVTARDSCGTENVGGIGHVRLSSRG